jgi:hypothetical protein
VHNQNEMSIYPRAGAVTVGTGDATAEAGVKRLRTIRRFIDLHRGRMRVARVAREGRNRGSRPGRYRCPRGRCQAPSGAGADGHRNAITGPPECRVDHLLEASSHSSRPHFCGRLARESSRMLGRVAHKASAITVIPGSLSRRACEPVMHASRAAIEIQHFSTGPYSNFTPVCILSRHL